MRYDGEISSTTVDTLLSGLRGVVSAPVMLSGGVSLMDTDGDIDMNTESSTITTAYHAALHRARTEIGPLQLKSLCVASGLPFRSFIAARHLFLSSFASLRNLSIATPLSSLEWNAMGEIIVFDKLEMFDVSNVCPPYHALVLFLLHHKYTLRRVRIGGLVEYPSSPQGMPPKTGMPSLSSFSGSAYSLFTILDRIDDSPRLRNIIVVSSSHDSTPTLRDQIDVLKIASATLTSATICFCPNHVGTLGFLGAPTFKREDLEPFQRLDTLEFRKACCHSGDTLIGNDTELEVMVRIMQLALNKV